jgi:hypothetical protein
VPDNCCMAVWETQRGQSLQDPTAVVPFWLHSQHGLLSVLEALDLQLGGVGFKSILCCSTVARGRGAVAVGLGLGLDCV